MMPDNLEIWLKVLPLKSCTTWTCLDKREELGRLFCGSRHLLSSFTTRVLSFKLPSDLHYTLWNACLITCYMHPHASTK